MGAHAHIQLHVTKPDKFIYVQFSRGMHNWVELYLAMLMDFGFTPPSDYHESYIRQNKFYSVVISGPNVSLLLQ